MQPLPFHDQIPIAVSQWQDRVSRAGNPTTDAIRFIERWMPVALRIEYETKIPAAFLIAQAAIESTWGTSRICRLGNNYFGVKWYSGKAVWDGDAYQCYATPEASWIAQGKLLTNSRYRSALVYRDDIQRYAREVQRLGYCPNQQYAQLVNAIVSDFLLKEKP